VMFHGCCQPLRWRPELLSNWEGRSQRGISRKGCAFVIFGSLQDWAKALRKSRPAYGYLAGS